MARLFDNLNNATGDETLQPHDLLRFIPKEMLDDVWSQLTARRLNSILGRVREQTDDLLARTHKQFGVEQLLRRGNQITEYDLNNRTSLESAVDGTIASVNSIKETALEEFQNSQQAQQVAQAVSELLVDILSGDAVQPSKRKVKNDQPNLEEEEEKTLTLSQREQEILRQVLVMNLLSNKQFLELAAQALIQKGGAPRHEIKWGDLLDEDAIELLLASLFVGQGNPGVFGKDYMHHKRPATYALTKLWAGFRGEDLNYMGTYSKVWDLKQGEIQALAVKMRSRGNEVKAELLSLTHEAVPFSLSSTLLTEAQRNDHPYDTRPKPEAKVVQCSEVASQWQEAGSILESYYAHNEEPTRTLLAVADFYQILKTKLPLLRASEAYAPSEYSVQNNAFLTDWLKKWLTDLLLTESALARSEKAQAILTVLDQYPQTIEQQRDKARTYDSVGTERYNNTKENAAKIHELLGDLRVAFAPLIITSEQLQAARERLVQRMQADPTDQATLSLAQLLQEFSDGEVPPGYQANSSQH